MTHNNTESALRIIDAEARRRIKFHMGEKGSMRECAPLIEAYERRCRAVLGPSAADLGVSTHGFWTLDEFKSALFRKMRADGESTEAVRRLRTTYDVLLRDLNEGDAHDADTVLRIRELTHPDRFLDGLTKGRTTTDPVALNAMDRVRRGGRYEADIVYLKRTFPS